MVYDKLHKSIVHLEWGRVEETLSTDKGLEMAKEAFKDDLPLHMALYRRAPDKLILSLLQANQDAVAIRGKNKSLPLHAAAQQNLSPNVIVSLIKAYPEALDMQNDSQCTPRDFHQRNDMSRDALHRPTACWHEDVEKDEYTKKVMERRKELKEKLVAMKETLEISKKKRKMAAELLATVEPQVARQQEIMASDRLQEEKVKMIKTKLDERIRYMKERIEFLEEKYQSDKSKEDVMIRTALKRAYMEDAQKKYEKVTQTHDQIKQDLKALRELVSEKVANRERQPQLSSAHE